MKRFTSLFVCFVLFGFQAMMAQDVQMSGTVTDAIGAPLPGVSIVVKGTTTGTASNVDGNYELPVPPGATLVFSSVGMKSQEIAVGNQTVIDMVLEFDIVGLDEVVVTALGITREKKALGYSVQHVSGEELSQVKETNIVNSLQGKVAGVQINSSSGTMGGSSRILIRGANSVKGNNQPLFVVDGIILDNSNFRGGMSTGSVDIDEDQETGRGGYDYGNAAQDLNPNDIETISVLKGGSAAALYGSRASNGVILITTKSGKEARGKKGIGISYNGSVVFEQLSILPDYQDSYGGGYGFDTLWYNTLTADEQAMYMPVGGAYTDATNGPYDLIPHYAVDESWGPKLDGQTNVRHWDSWDSWDTENFGLSRPWETSPHDVDDFFETGVTYNNSVALTGGSNLANFRLSYTNMNKSGVFPESKLKRNTVNFSGDANLSKKLSAFAKINYVNTYAKGRPGTGYDGMNPMQSFNQWTHRQLDYNRLKNYKNPDGTQRTWNRQAYNVPEPMYTDNPYWVRKENYQDDTRNRYFGNIGARYILFDWLNLSGKIHLDQYSDRREERRAVGSNDIPAYTEHIRGVREINYEFLINFNKDLSQMFRLSGFIGANSMNRTYHRNAGLSSGGLGVPNWYHLDNSLDLPTVDDYNDEKKINSIFGNASLSYRDLLFLDFTLRSDWSSTLPEDNNNYNYPSVSAGFMFSELLNATWLPFAKLRASWAKVGSDTDPYDTQLTYRPYPNFGPNPRLSVPATLNNPDLKPEMTTSIELGVDLKFINNRVGLDVTYYDNKTEDQIIPVDISATSGYRSYIINAGLMTNKGVEVMAYVTPVQTGDFSWEIYANWAKNTNKVEELAPGLDNLMLNTAPFRVSINAKVGETYGTILGNNYVYEGGKKVVNSSGMYSWSSDLNVLGTAMADWTGGLGNTVTYKGLRLNFLIDAQKGGQYFSTSHMFGTYAGITKTSTENNIREDGIVLDGVMDDGDGNYVPNTTVLDAESYGLNHYLLDPLNIFDSDFFKLRELSLGYTLPKSLTGNLPFENITISFIGRNLATWGTDNKNFDPEQATSTSNFQGLESAQLPSIRSYGFSLSFNL